MDNYKKKTKKSKVPEHSFEIIDKLYRTKIKGIDTNLNLL